MLSVAREMRIGDACGITYELLPRWLRPGCQGRCSRSRSHCPAVARETGLSPTEAACSNRAIMALSRDSRWAGDIVEGSSLLSWQACRKIGVSATAEVRRRDTKSTPDRACLA